MRSIEVQLFHFEIRFGRRCIKLCINIYVIMIMSRESNTEFSLLSSVVVVSVLFGHNQSKVKTKKKKRKRKKIVGQH